MNRTPGINAVRAAADGHGGREKQRREDSKGGKHTTRGRRATKEKKERRKRERRTKEKGKTPQVKDARENA